MTVYKDNMKTNADATSADDELNDFSKELNDMDAGKQTTSPAEELAMMAMLDDMTEVVEETIIAGDEAFEDELALALEAPSDVLDPDELRDLDMAIDRQEAYAEQESVAIGTVAPPAPGSGVVKSTRKTRVVGAAGDPKVVTPRAARDLKDVAPDFFVLSGDTSTFTAADFETAKTNTLALMPTQVKIAEKFENLFVNLAAGKLPSSYTMLAFKLLESHPTITSADLIAAYKADGRGEGTARSQTGQMLTLFDVVGLATRTGQSLTINPTSAIGQRIRDLSAVAAAA